MVVEKSCILSEKSADPLWERRLGTKLTSFAEHFQSLGISGSILWYLTTHILAALFKLSVAPVIWEIVNPQCRWLCVIHYYCYAYLGLK